VRQYANPLTAEHMLNYFFTLIVRKYFEVAILPQLFDTESIKVFFFIKQALLLRFHIGYVQRRIQEEDERIEAFPHQRRIWPAN
jgi:hypothetical protein